MKIFKFSSGGDYCYAGRSRRWKRILLGGLIGAGLGAGIGGSFVTNAYQIYYDFGEEYKGINLQSLEEKNPEAAKLLVKELSFLTGMSINVGSNDKLGYARIRKVGSKNKGRDAVSKARRSSPTARKKLLATENHAMTLVAASPPGTGSRTFLGGNVIELSMEQSLEYQQAVTSNLEPLTSSMGMLFFHEYGHTGPGGAYEDYGEGGPESIFDEGLNEKKHNYNQIRKEMNGSTSKSWGMRRTYTHSIPWNGDIYFYIAFNTIARRAILNAVKNRTLPQFRKGARYIETKRTIPEIPAPEFKLNEKNN